MKHARTTMTILLCLLVGHAPGRAAPDSSWQPLKQAEGITVYTRTVAGSDIIKVKTRVVIAAPLRHIQRILDNIPQRTRWVPYLQQSRLLHSLNEHEKLEYSLFAAPWPVSDRDFVYRIRRLQDDQHSLVYSMKSELSEKMPQQPGVVRAELVESRYSLTRIDAQHTHLELTFHTDPKGWLPSWIINIIQKELPFRMLKNLRSRAEAGVTAD